MRPVFSKSSGPWRRGAFTAVTALTAGLASVTLASCDQEMGPAQGQSSLSCSFPASGPAAKDVGTPAEKPSTKPFTARLALTQGEVAFEALTAKAPCTTASFQHLASKGYFDATKCHRLTTAGLYVLQCGDPTGSGSGGPGYSFADENLAGASYPAGTVAMANAGAGTNGSQFFLVYQDTQLPPNYTPFGKITTGLETLRRIAATGEVTGAGDGAPKEDVVIKKVTIVQK